jgi:hypothetical protein
MKKKETMTKVFLVITILFTAVPSVFADQADLEKPKSYFRTFAIDAVPYFLIGSGMITCPFLSNEQNPIWEDSDRSNCYKAVHVSSLFLLGFGTIPSDIYLDSSVQGSIAFTLSKLAINGLFLLSGEYFGGGDVPNHSRKYLNYGLLPGLCATSVLYFIEMIGHGFQVHKYNEELRIKTTGLKYSIAPLVWKDRTGLSFLLAF